MKFDIDGVLSERMLIDKLEVQSFEMNVYLVKLYVGENSGMLYQKGQLKRFHSSQQIRDTFENAMVVRAVMIHESPYDEMIGNPPKASESMAVPFSMTQPY